MQRLPLDTSTFSRLRQEGHIYVDKTEYIYRSLTQGYRYFLSRPRRFGKSLLISTFNEVLIGNRQLFDGLWIANSDYQWQKHGVIKLDFSILAAKNATAFESSLKLELISIAKTYGVTINPSLGNAGDILKQLIDELYKIFGRTAILVDEYDSPILKTVEDESSAKEIRNTIQQFFTVIKGLDAQVQFVFIAGVSSFAKAGLFSGINNLQNITLRAEYATICGYTDEEIDHYFAEYITQWVHKDDISRQQLRQKIKYWYNGYHFGKDVIAVYNPFSVMYALRGGDFENFWFQSGTPTFLVEALKKNFSLNELDNLYVSQDFLGIFDVGNIPPIALMFQAGYLTIADYDSESELYKLDYPNNEVRVAFQQYLLEVFTHVSSNDAARTLQKIKIALINENIEEVVKVLYHLFAHIPYQLYSNQEKYYHSLFMMICIGAGINVQSEYSTNLGRIDLVLEFSKIIYVIEVKFNDTADKALQQIEERRYYERFTQKNKKVVLLGLAFERKPEIFNIMYATKIIE